MTEQQNRDEWLAGQIMGVTRDRLLEELPYMNRALLRMPASFYRYEPSDEETPATDKKDAPDDGVKKLPPGMGTDGRLVYADTDYVLHAWREDRIRLSRTYLHMILHCLFQHPFRYGRMDRRRWDFAADAAVEDAVLSMDIRSIQLDDDWKLKAKLDMMKQMVGSPFTAERIYHYLGEHDAPFDVEHLTSDSERQEDGETAVAPRRGAAASAKTAPPAWSEDALLFHRDLHEPWLFNSESMPEEVIRRGGEDTGGKWRTISQGVQHDMEMHEKNQSLEPGSLSRVLRIRYQKENSYAEFLKRFAKLTEDLHISTDEFDYIYYMYGLELYRNVPLIEPLEYRETDRIRDFVIAIDTSGSCQGHVIRSFLQKTWNIMKESGVFTGDLNLHIMQADADVQRDDVIRSQDDFDMYMKNVEVRGSGGTDFRPVFHRVDALRRNGEFPHLQGLIYFTDGYGIFPQERPEYPVAFVFVRDQWEIPKIPAWAYQIVLPAGRDVE